MDSPPFPFKPTVWLRGTHASLHGEASDCELVSLAPSSRGHSSPPGSPKEAEVGADVEADCREGAHEHALHFSGRPGNRNQRE